MAEDIQLWSDELARNPASLAFVPLADALRRRGQLDLARKVITRGLERHPRDGDAHDVMARIWADRGEVQRAMEEWKVALQCAPQHAGALKGLAFAHFQAGRLADAERLLVQAVAADPDDASTRTAVGRVRVALGGNGSVEDLAPMSVQSPAVGESHGTLLPETDHQHAPPAEAGPPPDGVSSNGASPSNAHTGEPSLELSSTDVAADELRGEEISPPPAAEGEPEIRSHPTPEAGAVAGAGSAVVSASSNPAVQARELFTDLLGSGEQAALLLDAQGLVIAGTYFVAEGHDAAEDVGAALSGVSDEARRAMRHLELGAWTSLVFETDAATVAMGPLDAGTVAEDGLALVAASRSVPLGFVRQLLRRVTQRSTAWLGAENGGRDS